MSSKKEVKVIKKEALLLTEIAASKDDRASLRRLRVIFLSSEKVSSIFTTYSPDTIRKLAKLGKLPVARWEPIFRGDAETFRAIHNLQQKEGKINASKRT